MNDSFGDFNATQTASGAGAASEQKAEGIVSVLIKQVLLSPEGNFQMFNMTFGMVTCVAIVRSIDTSSTKITYTLEDHTGRIEAHYWLEEGDAMKAPDLMLNNYAKIFGSVRSQGGKKTLMVFKMQPVTDPNEICTHVLEVLNARYKAEQFSKSSGEASGFGDFTSGSGGFGVQNSNTGGNYLGLEGKQLAIFQAIKNNMDPEGIHRKELQRKFTHISPAELNTTIEFLISEGHIYSSSDSDHFVSSE